jgi:hypothetical protein
MKAEWLCKPLGSGDDCWLATSRLRQLERHPSHRITFTFQLSYGPSGAALQTIESTTSEGLRLTSFYDQSLIDLSLSLDITY